MKQRYYVSVTWEDWPEGGSFGTIVEAESYEEAKNLAFYEMAKSLADQRDWPDTVQQTIDYYTGCWHVVDCFPLDDFLRRHWPPTTPEPDRDPVAINDENTDNH